MPQAENRPSPRPEDSLNATPGEAAMSCGATEPGRDCALCPRLEAFRLEWRTREPIWFNAPVPSFGPNTARLLIVGLAPGLQGANRTGRPFTGDHAGLLLYDTLSRFGFAKGTYAARPDDGLELVDARITNAVRCVPPENKPTGAEIATCRDFLERTIAEMPKLRALVVLGRIAHDTAATALAARRSEVPFAHGASHAIGEVRLFDSYHCSRYNTNTGVLTPEMFRSVFARVREFLDA
jgi:uracil-DNA glycosylase